MWWQELGPGGGAGAARRLQRAGRGGLRAAGDARSLTCEPLARCAASRAQGDLEARVPLESRRSPRAAAGRSTPPELMRLDRADGGRPSPALVAAGELTPQSRGSSRRGRGARPARGRAGARPLRRPRDQDRPDRRADGRPRRGDLGRARPRPGRGSRGTGPAPRAAQRHRDRGRRGGDGDGVRLRPGPARRALLGPRRPRLAPGRALAQVAEGDRAAGRRSRSRPCSAPPGRCGPAASSSTRPARSPAARTRTGSRRCSPRPRRGRCRRSSWRTSAPAPRASPRRSSRAACSCVRTAIAPPASSSPA